LRQQHPLTDFFGFRERPQCGSVTALSWTPDGTELAGAGGNGTVVIAQLVQRRLEWENFEVCVVVVVVVVVVVEVVVVCEVVVVVVMVVLVVVIVVVVVAEMVLVVVVCEVAVVVMVIVVVVLW
jgi:type IV secretory pathway VirB6-like protein